MWKSNQIMIFKEMSNAIFIFICYCIIFIRITTIVFEFCTIHCK